MAEGVLTLGVYPATGNSVLFMEGLTVVQDADGSAVLTLTSNKEHRRVKTIHLDRMRTRALFAIFDIEDEAGR
jgi:hypothetical protein